MNLQSLLTKIEEIPDFTKSKEQVKLRGLKQKCCVRYIHECAQELLRTSLTAEQEQLVKNIDILAFTAFTTDSNLVGDISDESFSPLPIVKPRKFKPLRGRYKNW